MKNILLNTLMELLLAAMFTSTLIAQTTGIKLPAVDSSANFRVLNSSDANLFRLNGDAGFFYSGTYGSGAIPATGTGMRFMWYPKKAAFRAGIVNGTEWDDANIGNLSVAMGLNTKASNGGATALGEGTIASGSLSTAMGLYTTASGDASTATGAYTNANGNYSTAMGLYTTASGDVSTATGANTNANGNYSTAMGAYTTASGNFSIAMGYNTTASNTISTAMGYLTTASGLYSTAMGRNTTASGQYSTAMGSYVSTNGTSGSCMIGDYSTTVITISSAANQMTMRFAGGYRLFSNSGLSTGVTLAAGGNSWSSVSDARKKENLLNANGEYFLNSLAQLKLGSWNYIGQDPKNFRHYGPMAQEIFKYFGNDGIGTMGNDTTLASADMDGIMMICLQALEKRTTELNTALHRLQIEKEKVVQLDNHLFQQKAEQEKSNAILLERIERLENVVASSAIKKSNQSLSNK